MLEDLQAAEGDMAAALPAVGEEESEPGKFRSLGISQFSLLEESGPSMAPTQLTGPLEQHAKTLEVLASLRQLTTSTELSLSQATIGLRRLEDAQVFSHILGKRFVLSCRYCNQAQKLQEDPLIFAYFSVVFFAVGRSKGFIRATQDRPYDDIIISFPWIKE